MEILRNFYGVSKGVSMVVLWDSYGVSKGCLWDFHWISIRFLWDLYGISMKFYGFSVDSYRISMIFP